jgi:hypothetical protein
VSEDHIRHASPQEGFDRSEPKAGAIAAFGIASVVALAITILALQSYFNKIWDEAVTEKILLPPSEQLRELRARDDWNLTHYMYGGRDPKSGRVRIPVDKAMELFAEEAAAGKLFYPAKATMPKKEEPEATPGAAPGAAAPGATAGAAPGTTPGATAGAVPGAAPGAPQPEKK